MAKKRHTAEQIIAKLRGAEVPLAVYCLHKAFEAIIEQDTEEQ